MNRAQKRCAEPNCTELTTHTRCPQHKKQHANQTRHNYHRNTYTTDWPRISRTYRHQHPTCECKNQTCKCQGHCTQPSTDVDHIIAIRLYPARDRQAANNTTNLQALCHSCHSHKTMIEIRTVLA